MKTIELKVTGMTCKNCERHVADAIETVSGVEKAIADHRHDRVLVRLTDDDASVDAMKAAIEDDTDFKMVEVVE
ncbi:copper chaperone [Acetitomaculum ruminis DSM 5522]|uniref:Copper chaperone n=1 Tax=Acetitomaculum ruminis DSM 5522 TaxID=1120918 RepID=A0A1I0ZAK2_9FIRM|nr:cation transporter [Acetitomaculum ruminis]SFB22561.1 copper chaperone [Acetitomaculum ruminis DSM 5522]